jgi:hypothetical protein
MSADDKEVPHMSAAVTSLGVHVMSIKQNDDHYLVRASLLT